MKKIQLLVLLCFVFPHVFGCVKTSQHGVVVVTGTVTVEGQPMEGIDMIFHPVAGEIAAFGSTNAQGKYKLSSPSTPVGAGAMEGEYVATFTKTTVESRPPASKMEERRYRGIDGTSRVPVITHHIPEKYGDRTTCGIAPVKVEKGKTNVFDFDLSTK